jgi:hypothetical protein
MVGLDKERADWGGRENKVNSYMESDRPLVEEILRWYTAGRA